MLSSPSLPSPLFALRSSLAICSSFAFCFFFASCNSFAFCSSFAFCDSFAFCSSFASEACALLRRVSRHLVAVSQFTFPGNTPRFFALVFSQVDPRFAWGHQAIVVSRQCPFFFFRSPRRRIRPSWRLRRTMVGLGCLYSVSYIKLIPTHEELFAVGKKWPECHF